MSFPAGTSFLRDHVSQRIPVSSSLSKTGEETELLVQSLRPYFMDSKCPEALWRLPTPRPTIYHLSLLEVRRNQTPLPRCPGRPQHKLTALRFLCSFPRHWHHLLRFFFLSLLLLLIFLSLLPQFSLPSFPIRFGHGWEASES